MPSRALTLLCLITLTPSEVSGEPLPWFVGADNARRLITKGASLLDARSAAAYKRGHLGGAIHAPWQRFARRGELAPGSAVTPLYLGRALIGSARAFARHGKTLDGG